MKVGDRYGKMGRLLHRIAFRVGAAQHALSDVEGSLYEGRLDDITADDPVFITALPRSGTTILLKLLWQSGHFAAHTYRDMPFVLCPLIWSRYTGQFAGEIEPTERAHGDGLEVSGESPEAFEEMIWKHFWPARYGGDRIEPWRPEDQNEEFDSFFRSHMRKMIAIRQEEVGKNPDQLRYLSKNNLNIARLGALPAPLEEGRFVIPFRDPVQQAASMQRQHERFLQIHEEDDFTREYMEAIGHHEFGKGLKPVNFGGWLSGETGSPGDLSFWLRYWTAGYQFVLEHASGATAIVSYARLTEMPETVLPRLAEVLALPSEDLLSFTDKLRTPRTHPVDRKEIPNSLLKDAEETYGRLNDQAAV